MEKKGDRLRFLSLYLFCILGTVLWEEETRMTAGVAFPLIQQPFRIGVSGEVWLGIRAVAYWADSNVFIFHFSPLFHSI